MAKQPSRSRVASRAMDGESTQMSHDDEFLILEGRATAWRACEQAGSVEGQPPLQGGGGAWRALPRVTGS